MEDETIQAPEESVEPEAEAPVVEDTEAAEPAPEAETAVAEPVEEAEPVAELSPNPRDNAF